MLLVFKGWELNRFAFVDFYQHLLTCFSGSRCPDRVSIELHINFPDSFDLFFDLRMEIVFGSSVVLTIDSVLNLLRAEHSER